MKSWYDISFKEKIERWENALRVLRSLSPHERKEHWNMGSWGIKTDCGTIACAAGHCGLDPWFIKKGFKLIPKEIDEGLTLNDVFDYGLGDFSGNNNVTDFFGHLGTETIFYDTRHRPVSEVIKEITNHIKYLKKQYADIITYEKKELNSTKKAYKNAMLEAKKEYENNIKEIEHDFKEDLENSKQELKDRLDNIGDRT